MNKYNHIKVVKINVECQLGTDLVECLKEGMSLAINEWKKVDLIFNDKSDKNRSPSAEEHWSAEELDEEDELGLEDDE